MGFPHVSGMTEMTGASLHEVFSLPGASPGVSYSGRMASGSKRGQTPKHGNFQASAYVIFINVPLAKLNPIGSSACIQRGVIYGGHYCNNLSQHVPNCHSNPAVPTMWLRCPGTPQ